MPVADEQDVVMQADPLAGGQGTHEFAVQAARVLVVDILQDAPLLELGQLQPPGQGAALFPGPLAVDQQAEPLFEAELAGVGRLELFPECFRHAVQLHGVQSFDRRLIQHVILWSVVTAAAWWAAGHINPCRSKQT